MELITTVINNLIMYLEGVGIIGGFILVLLESIFPIMPLALFIGMNILAFGNVTGFLISYVGTIFGCMMSFVLFSFLQSFLYKILNKKTKEKLDKLMNKMKDIDFNALVIIHAMPFTPAFLTNIAAGLSGMKKRKYLVSLLIGKISIVYFWGYVGKNFLSSIKDPVVLIKIFLLVIGAYLISKIVEKIIKVEE